MKAWLLDDFTGINRLRVAEVAAPVAQASEGVLQLQYAALNPADAYLAEGQYPAKPPLPHILGRDGIGEVAALGPNVQGLKAGEKRVILRSEVGISRWGTFADLVAVPVESLVEVPPGWSDEQTAG